MKLLTLEVKEPLDDNKKFELQQRIISVLQDHGFHVWWDWENDILELS